MCHAVQDVAQLIRLNAERGEKLERLSQDTNRLVTIITDLESKLYLATSEKVKLQGLLREADNTLQQLGVGFEKDGIREKISAYIVMQHMYAAI